MRIFLDILLYLSRVKKYLTLSYENTRERNNYKKQPFLHREIK
tara:strand:+ start:71 stop:199 length:129 start_codon:yes stop_codon:yes gene_type:complete